MCNHHARQGPQKQASSPVWSMWQLVCKTKEFLYKLSESISGKLIRILVFLTRVLNRLHVVVETNLSGQMLTFDGVAGTLEKFETWLSLYWVDDRQCLWCCVGRRSGDVPFLNWVPHGGGSVMVWTANTWGILVIAVWVRRYSEEILTPVVTPFIHHYHFRIYSMQGNVSR